MTNKQLFVEPRKGQPGYQVKKANAKRASSIHSNQAEAIAAAKEQNPDAKPHVARVRHTSKGHPDQFRR